MAIVPRSQSADIRRVHREGGGQIGRRRSFLSRIGRLDYHATDGTDAPGDHPSGFAGSRSPQQPETGPASDLDPQSSEFHRGEQAHPDEHGTPESTTVADGVQKSLGHETDADHKCHLAGEGNQQGDERVHEV